MDILDGTDAVSKEVVSGVQNTKFVEGSSMNLLRFELEPEATVPRHDHPHEQLGYIIEGTPTLVTDDDERTLSPGDTYAIRGDESHSLVNQTSSRVVGLDVFSPPRSFAPFAED